MANSSKESQCEYPPYCFAEETRLEWDETLQQGFPIPDPNDELIEIYEIDTLVQALGIRAEKWDSPEWRCTQEFEKILAGAQIAAEEKRREAAESKIKIRVQGETMGSVQIPRNLQNPNYTELLDGMQKLRKKKSTKAFSDLLTMVEKYIHKLNKDASKLTVYRLNWVPDVRFLRVKLSEHDVDADRTLIMSLIMSYFYGKYVVCEPMCDKL